MKVLHHREVREVTKRSFKMYCRRPKGESVIGLLSFSKYTAVSNEDATCLDLPGTRHQIGSGEGEGSSKKRGRRGRQPRITSRYGSGVRSRNQSGADREDGVAM